MESDRDNPACERLADALRGRVDGVLSTWERAVQREVAPAAALTPADLRDAMPDVLDRMWRTLGEGGRRAFDDLARRASEHGDRRFLQQYAVSDLLVEYRLLRRATFEHAAAAVDGGLTTVEVLALNAAIDLVAQAAVSAFAAAQRAHLERAAEVEARFLAYLAHDQRNHLNHALLLLEVHTVEVGQYPELAQSAADLREVREAIRQTTSGMERLMQAERLRRGGMEPDRLPVRPADLVRSLVGGFAAEVSAKGLRIETVVTAPAETHPAETHPAETHPAEMHTDPALLGLVLTNLVGNAVKFSATGVVRVTAEPAAEVGGWRFAVADQGPGIAPDQVGRLFDAFVRGETHGQSGMGLGLSIASQAARLLSGRLTVQSSLGVGSTFTLTVPDVPPAV